MNQEYIERLKKIEAELNRWLPETAVNWSGTDSPQFSKLEKVFPGLGKELDSLPLEPIFAPLTDILSRGGKRWRPLLMTLVCETLGGGDAALPLTPLVEFSHNASLIHDDIEDDSDERRGKPAVHHLYGMDTAINSGSFFYFLSLCCIDSYYGDDKDKIYKLWGDHMRKLHMGQSMDIHWHRDISIVPSIEDYYTMCGMKTGCLASLAAELGAFTAGAQDSMQKFGKAAMKLGIGFQILDDVKNLANKIPGKKHGDDIVEGKKSLPVLLYLNKYPKKRELIFFYFYEAKEKGYNAPEVQDLINILTETGVLDEAEEKAQSLIKEAREVLDTPLLNGLIDLIS
jgi:octaprenyl-diphosphate synthase